MTSQTNHLTVRLGTDGQRELDELLAALNAAPDSPRPWTTSDVVRVAIHQMHKRRVRQPNP
jgi:hypothetical protein